MYYHHSTQHGLELPAIIPAYVTVTFGSAPLTYPSCCVFEVTGMPTIMYVRNSVQANRMCCKGTSVSVCGV